VIKLVVHLMSMQIEIKIVLYVQDNLPFSIWFSLAQILLMVSKYLNLVVHLFNLTIIHQCLQVHFLILGYSCLHSFICNAHLLLQNVLNIESFVHKIE
jgi:hypothetical protein